MLGYCIYNCKSLFPLKLFSLVFVFRSNIDCLFFICSLPKVHVYLTFSFIIPSDKRRMTRPERYSSAVPAAMRILKKNYCYLGQFRK